MTTPPPPSVPNSPRESSESNPFRYVVTEGFAELLDSLNCTLAATTYQAGKLVLFRVDGDRVSALFRSFDSAMGLAVAQDRLAIGTRNSIWLLCDAPDVGRQLDPPGKHDACFIPRIAHVTGDIRIHELVWCDTNDAHVSEHQTVNRARSAGGREALDLAEPQLWFVNTRFSCLCTLHSDFSFVPRWVPPFLSALVPEDRCHLNGLAVVGGRPAYVTALGISDTKEGWRADKSRRGVVIDVATGRAVTDGMSMPHSPRVHEGKLLVLNSGAATLENVDAKTGNRETIARLPGYARGLAVAGKYAFVGLSKIREQRDFGGLPIEKSIAQLKCGVACVNLETGRIAELIEFETGCEEIFDVQLILGRKFPAVIGLKKDTIDGVFVVPSDAANRLISLEGPRS